MKTNGSDLWIKLIAILSYAALCVMLFTKSR
jgi:hypothetical protein